MDALPYFKFFTYLSLFLCGSCQNTSTLGPESTVSTLPSASFSTPAELATSATTTTIVTSNIPTTGRYICRTSLNTNPNLSPFWIVTVLSSVPSSINVSSCEWRDQMETRLLTLLAAARAQSSSGGKRRRRAAESGQLILQLVSSSRSSSSNSVTLVYYAMLRGSYLAAESVISSLAAVSSSADSILGYSVESLANSYETVNDSRKLWLIGAMLGALCSLLLVIWLVLFVYQRCLRPFDPAGDRRFLDDSHADDFYTTDDMAHLPDMRANPRIGYSKTDIGTIAEEVAKHLDSQYTSELVITASDVKKTNSRPQQHSPRDESVGEETSSQTLPSDQFRSTTALEATDSTDGKMGATNQRTKKRKTKPRKNVKDDIEEEPNQDLNNKFENNELPVDEEPAIIVPVDAGVTAKAINLSQSAPTGWQPENSEDIPEIHVTQPGSELSDFTGADIGSLAMPSSRALTLPSPYRTGDQLAKLRPLLEQDLLTQNASESHAPPADAAAGSRIISVQPRQPTRTFNNAINRTDNVKDAPLSSLSPNVVNQDEWDVVRQLASRPGSDTRALLGAVRHELLTVGVSDSTSGPTN